MLKLVWLLAVAAFAIWSLLAWAGLALIDGGSAGLIQLAGPVIDNVQVEGALDTAMRWVDAIGSTLLWFIWGAGSIGLAIGAVFATLLLRKRQAAVAMT
jgi:hypothetical protein